MIIPLKLTTLKSAAIQVAVGLIANWGMLNAGLTLGFPSAVVPPLLGSGPGLHTSIDEASWVASLPFISGTVACLLTGQLIDWLGRRWGLLLLSLVSASGWLLIAVLPDSLLALYAGRLITGVGVGMAYCTSGVYSAEVTDVALRTSLVTLSPIMLAVGVLLIYIWLLFHQTSWTEVSYFAFGIIMISVVLTPLLPESPLWLLNKSRAEEALQALMKLRGASNPDQVKDEMDSFSSRARDNRNTSSWLSTICSLSKPHVYKPLLIMNMFFLFQQISGVTILMVFGVRVSKNAGIMAHPYNTALALSCTRILGMFITTWVCSKYGKRFPALLSGTVMFATMLLLALEVSPVLQLPLWLVTALLLLFVFASSVGFSTLPLSMIGEVFPTDVRGICSGITTFFGLLATFAVTKIYPGMVISLGVFPVFLLFATSALIGTIFLYIFLPETNGKSLLEIEEHFKCRS